MNYPSIWSECLKCGERYVSGNKHTCSQPDDHIHSALTRSEMEQKMRPRDECEHDWVSYIWNDYKRGRIKTWYCPKCMPEGHEYHIESENKPQPTLSVEGVLDDVDMGTDGEILISIKSNTDIACTRCKVHELGEAIGQRIRMTIEGVNHE